MFRDVLVVEGIQHDEVVLRAFAHGALHVNPAVHFDNLELGPVLEAEVLLRHSRDGRVDLHYINLCIGQQLAQCSGDGAATQADDEHALGKVSHQEGAGHHHARVVQRKTVRLCQRDAGLTADAAGNGEAHAALAISLVHQHRAVLRFLGVNQSLLSQCRRSEEQCSGHQSDQLLHALFPFASIVSAASAMETAIIEMKMTFTSSHSTR